MKHLKGWALVLAMALCFVACGNVAFAADYPAQDVRVVVPYAAGGNTDLDGRAISNIVETNKLFSKMFIVTNITGANTMNALQAVMDAEADGYTLFLTHTAFIASSVLGTVDIVYEDLAPLIEFSIQPFVLSVATSSGFTSVDEIVAYANEHPGELTIGYTGTGSTSHLSATIFLQAADLYGKVNMITYSSSVDGITAQLGGELVMRIGPAADCARYIESKDLLPLAVSCATTNPIFTGVPSFEDLGSKISYACRQGVYVRPETPDDVRGALVKALGDAVAAPEYAGFCAANGMMPSGLSGDELKAAWNGDYATIKEIFDSGVMN